jgi:FMN-dependent NADH-azoreductase
MKILHVISSPRGEASNSTRLGNRIIDRLKQLYPGSTVHVNNVVERDYAHLNGYHVDAYTLHIEDHGPMHKETARSSDAAVEELLAADIIVISLPLYNFQVPSALKAWIDHIVRKDKTVGYRNGRREGLAQHKKVYLAIASAGVYSNGPMKEYDFAEPYLRYILGYIGITDISTFRIEGASVPGVMETAVEKGLESVVI